MSDAAIEPGLAEAGAERFARALVLAGWAALFVALHLNLAAILLIPVGFAALPSDRRADLLLAGLDRWPAVLADGLALLAAAAVGWASGDPLRAVVGWAIPVVVTWRAASLRLPELALAPVALALAAAAWATGRIPSVGDGALAASIALAAPALLRFLPRATR